MVDMLNSVGTLGYTGSVQLYRTCVGYVVCSYNHNTWHNGTFTKF